MSNRVVMTAATFDRLLPFGLALVGLGIAMTARLGLEYPRCPTDEGNWIAILHYLDAGIDWPVSGPAYVGLLRGLAAASSLPYETLVPALAAASAAWLPPLLYLCYRHSGLNLQDALGSVVWLFSTSYFLAPLLEGRPQQWGMGLTVASFVLFVALRYRPAPALALGFLGIYGATFLVHLLSFLILNGLLAAYGLLEIGRGRRPGIAEGMLLGAGLVCLGVLWSDSGPYRAMMADLANFHFRALAWPWVAMAAIISAAALIMVGRYWKRLQAICVLRPVPCLLVLAAMLVLAFAVQTLLLPPAALAFYQGDFWRFLIAESGNLVFALSFIRGGWLLLREGGKTASYGTAAAILMVMGAGVLLLSSWMGSKNGMIRVMNYWTVFAAPLAWQGATSLGSWGRWLVAGWWPVGMMVSLAHTVRPQGWFGC